jgi:Rrf2 family transcriptional regulator, nitric oxide-sensitive transcriptional repressor
MQVTRYTDYAIRVLIYLAVNKDQKSTIHQIAESYSISKNHLMKIVQTLNSEGFLLATRGKNGGLKLNSNPNEINLGKLVRNLESHSNLVECFGDNNHCVITPSCQLKSILRQAVESFYKTLDQFTLADLVTPRSQTDLSQLLNISSIDNSQTN